MLEVTGREVGHAKTIRRRENSVYKSVFCGARGRSDSNARLAFFARLTVTSDADLFSRLAKHIAQAEFLRVRSHAVEYDEGSRTGR